MFNMLITVFTPAYNRARLLPRLYESLCRQTFKDFEWIIVDDGSSDDTSEVISKIQMRRKNSFPIWYFRKANGGKHTAINVGVNASNGKIFLILDSDDLLPDRSLEIIADKYKEIEGNTEFGGICGYMAHSNGEVIGKPQIEATCNTLDLRYKLGVNGDMCEVFRTAVLKEFPFPETIGERFCPEALVWNRIAQRYQLKIFPDIIYIRDYLSGGLTDNIIRMRMESPINSMTTYQELLTYHVPVKIKLRSAINYWRFRMCLHQSSAASSIPKLKWYWNLICPIGWLMHELDKKTCH